MSDRLRPDAVRCGGAWRVTAAVVLLVVAASVAGAANRYDPRLRFRCLSTPRFDIFFHQGEEALAARLARIAEQVASDLDATLGPASGRVRVILVDQSDQPNGWATPVPYNVIEITAAAPGGESNIGNTNDWLRMVFSHEYTHVVHLSRSRGWIGGLRRVFGRQPLLFPNLFTPIWQIEGIAVFEESRETPHGRIHAGDFRMIVETASLASRFDPIDRANGGLDDWPSGTAPYVYGAYFSEFLVDKYGLASMRRLTDETARRVPYFGSTAYHKVFGRSLGDLWTDFAAEMRRTAPAPPSAASRLTRHGFNVTGPRFSADGRLYYSAANPHGFPALMRLEPDGASRVVTRKFVGNRIAFADGSIVFDELELVRNVGLQSDLYAYGPRGRHRLTRDARAADPDVAPDGRSIVCTLQRADRRELATLDVPGEGRLATPAAVVSEAETEFASPRWSPDGRYVAAERRRLHGPSEIVIVDVRTRDVRKVVVTNEGRNVTPIWTRDGGQLLFASDRDGGAFRLFRVDLNSGAVQRLEDTGVSAQSPALSPDGTSLVFVGYTADGYDLFSLPLATARWTSIGGNPEDAPASVPPPAASTPLPPSRPYRPWSTILPTFWTPTVTADNGEVEVGAATGSFDALGRHVYGADIEWTTSRGRPDWDVSYLYDRWWPTLFVNASDDTDPFREGFIRSKEANAGLVLPIRRVRWAQTLFGELHLSEDTLDCGPCTPSFVARANRNAVRSSWTFSSARSYGYSISREEGWAATVSNEATRRGLGADGNAGTAIVDLRAYREVVPRHGVIAARAAAATAWGDSAVRREFSASGSGPQPGGYRFDYDAIGLLRGFDRDDRTGRHAAVLNLDYRVPLVRLERGAGTLPLFVRVLHGAVFVDAGHTWDSGFRAGDVRVSVGGELSLDTVLGYSLPLTFTAGAAWRHDPVGRETGVATFGRIGRAF